jgi:hypothetical protein
LVRTVWSGWGRDFRREQLLDRNAELRRLLRHVGRNEPLMYVDHIERHADDYFSPHSTTDWVRLDSELIISIAG